MKTILITGFDGLRIIEANVCKDTRGLFLKTFNQSVFLDLGLETNYKERYYSKSRGNVIRGMHFHTPPYDHVKTVNVLHGAILDVVVDIRKESPSYKQYFTTELNDSDGRFLYIPKGFAHGFKALTDNAIVEYNQTSEYNKEADCGIRWDSFGFDWQTGNPTISERDCKFPALNNFVSPF
ncbi:MAG: dTDP-4-dehydrorhamnose 3,5-epimerase family protein [Tannerellaceae bacterium]|jgi:dTDP-4-dehydrorhamnose 3,5-epimerase|nr:dTDP-4-dehydrorhamnose 3,5-epimerase family protein [Tannerellaceae bacterium]